MKTRIFFLSAALFSFLIVGNSSGFDHIRYTDAVNGSDSGSGTAPGTSAWQSIFHAINQINSDTAITTGQTVILYVAPGTYSASVSAIPDPGSNNITITKSNITIKGAGKSSTILDGTNASASWYYGINIESPAENIIISDLSIRNFSSAGVSFGTGTGNSVVSCEISQNNMGITIINGNPHIGDNIITNNTSYGIYSHVCMGTSISPFIYKNSVSGHSTAGIHMDSCTGETYPVISGNIISRNTKGISLDLTDATAAPEILSNRIYDNQTGIYIRGYNLIVTPKIYNNIIYQQAETMSTGISLHAGTSSTGGVNAKIFHNTINGGTESGIYCDAASGTINAEIKYSIITNFSGGGSSYGIFNLNSALLDINYVDVWNNATGNFYQCSAPVNINADPQFASDFSIPASSPCADQVPAGEADPVGYDIAGTSRPRKKSSAGAALHDMGAYEYPYISYDLTMPGGTGLSTDYRLLTLPVQTSSTSLSDMLTAAYGPYNTEKWRVFAWNGTGYTELFESAFDSLTYNSNASTHAGRAFWVISLDGAFTNPLSSFEGTLTGNMNLQHITLETGWNIFALPWPPGGSNPSIELGNIVVSDDNNKFSLVSAANNLTDPCVWDYTGSGTTGYQKLELAADLLVPGKGYWINVTGASAELIIPPDNATYFTSLKKQPVLKERAFAYSKQPPAPPDSGENNLAMTKGDNGCFITGLFTP